MRRLFLFVASVAVATTVVMGSITAQAQTAAPISPGQIFNGFVNGQRQDATIQMACPGNARPGQLGHPAPGQTVAVARSLDLLPNGYTGAAHTVSVDLRLRLPIPHTVHLANFSVYRSQAIPTGILIPCTGDGDAVFSPVNGGPSARAVAVHVNLVG